MSSAGVTDVFYRFNFEYDLVLVVLVVVGLNVVSIHPQERAFINILDS
jgi:hypothetical protein